LSNDPLKGALTYIKFFLYMRSNRAQGRQEAALCDIMKVLALSVFSTTVSAISVGLLPFRSCDLTPVYRTAVPRLGRPEIGTIVTQAQAREGRDAGWQRPELLVGRECLYPAWIRYNYRRRIGRSFPISSNVSPMSALAHCTCMVLGCVQCSKQEVGTLG